MDIIKHLALLHEFYCGSASALDVVDNPFLIEVNCRSALDAAISGYGAAKRHGEDVHADVHGALQLALTKCAFDKSEHTGIASLYLIGCGLIQMKPDPLVVSFVKERTLEGLIGTGEPLAVFGAFGIFSAEDAMGAIVQAKTNELYRMSQESYFAFIQNGDVDAGEIETLFKRRKADEWYSTSRPYGGGPDNDLVCDIEILAISGIVGSEPIVIPCG